MTTAVETLRKKHADLGRKLQSAEKLLRGGPKSHRDVAREFASKKRKSERDLQIPAVEDRERRATCEADVFLFLETYFPHRFTNPWTDQQREMVEAILHAAKYGGDQAIAAPRGGGKTTLAECVAGIYCVVTGVLRFPVLCAASGPDAERILSNIKAEYEFNETLSADFPEVCYPIQALEGAPQRGGMQTVNGERTRIRWSGNHVVFPIVEGSKASGSVLMTRGCDAAIRGIRYGALRPDFVLIDDAETRESARSQPQCEVRERLIEEDISGLAGPGKKIARLMLCTIMYADCLSAKFTDRQQKPSWNGKRYRLIEEWPTDEEKWSNYIAKRKAGQESGDDLSGMEARDYYIADFEAMGLGAAVSDPNRFIRDLLPDGSPIEVSALQHCYNIIADRGLDAFRTEYQNDPPIEEGPESDKLTEKMVWSSLTGIGRRIVPDSASVLTAFIDVGKRRLHWGVVAWEQGGIGSVIDYGEQPTADPETYGAERAIRVALDELADRWSVDSEDGYPFLRSDGEIVPISLCPVDSGNWTSVIYEFCRTRGKPFIPSKGQGNYYQPRAASKDKIPGDRWYRSLEKRDDGNIWLLQMDPDHWKKWVHERFRTPSFVDDTGQRKRGSIALYGDEGKEHYEIAKHILAEEWRREFKEGKGWKEYWHTSTRKPNHYFDVIYGACVAASVCGIRLPVEGETRQRAVARDSGIRITLPSRL